MLKKLTCSVFVALMLLSNVGCGPLYVNARNTIAAGNGLITAAQAQYSTTCKVNPAQGVCVLINKGVDALAVAITAEETYCGFVLSANPDPNSTCTPVTTAASALNVALANLATIITQVKPLVTSKTTSQLIKEYDKPVVVTLKDVESFRMEAM